MKSPDMPGKKTDKPCWNFSTTLFFLDGLGFLDLVACFGMVQTAIHPTKMTVPSWKGLVVDFLVKIAKP